MLGAATGNVGPAAGMAGPGGHGGTRPGCELGPAGHGGASGGHSWVQRGMAGALGRCGAVGRTERGWAHIEIEK